MTCAGGFLIVNAIGTKLHDLIYHGAIARWRMMFLIETVVKSRRHELGVHNLAPGIQLRCGE